MGFRGPRFVPFQPRVGVKATAPVPPRRIRQKKGPRRLRKRATTADDLDREIEEYRAAAPEFHLGL